MINAFPLRLPKNVAFTVDSHFNEVSIRPMLRQLPEDRPRLKLPIYDRNHRNEPYRRT